MIRIDFSGSMNVDEFRLLTIDDMSLMRNSGLKHKYNLITSDFSHLEVDTNDIFFLYCLISFIIISLLLLLFLLRLPLLLLVFLPPDSPPPYSPPLSISQ